jgi:spermidine/putrescine transport system permease protein
MISIFKVYGRYITSFFLLCVAAWVLILIILPQIFMIDRSFKYEYRGDRLGIINNDLERLYASKLVKKYDLDFGPTCNEQGMVSVSMGRSITEGKIVGEAERECEEVLSSENKIKLEQEVVEINSQIEILLQEEEVAKIAKAAEFPYSFRNYVMMSGLHFKTLTKTIYYSIFVTVVALILCYPVAYVVALKSTPRKAAILFLALIIPYAVNELMRIYAWLTIFDVKGLLNTILDFLGILALDEDKVIVWYKYPGTVFTVMIYTYILFMVFPIYNTMSTLNRDQIEAAQDLGAKAWRIHWRIIIPHAKPGIAIGAIMTFMLSVGAFSVPYIITRGLQPKWFTHIIYDKFFESSNWNLGSAYSFTLLLISLIFVFVVMSVFRVSINELAKR